MNVGARKVSRTDLREGLLALPVGTGLQVMATMFDADVTAVAGPRGKHDAERVAVRRGSERGSVTLGWTPGGGDPAAGARRGRLGGDAGALL